jgi:hypothetical protein
VLLAADLFAHIADAVFLLYEETVARPSKAMRSAIGYERTNEKSMVAETVSDENHKDSRYKALKIAAATTIMISS